MGGLPWASGLLLQVTNTKELHSSLTVSGAISPGQRKLGHSLRTMALQATQSHTVKTSKHMPTLQWEAGNWLWDGWVGLARLNGQIRSHLPSHHSCSALTLQHAMPHRCQVSTRVSELVLALDPSLPPCPFRSPWTLSAIKPPVSAQPTHQGAPIQASRLFTNNEKKKSQGQL